MHARDRAGSYGSTFPRFFVSDPQPLSVRSVLHVEELFFLLTVFFFFDLRLVFNTFEHSFERRDL